MRVADGQAAFAAARAGVEVEDHGVGRVAGELPAALMSGMSWRTVAQTRPPAAADVCVAADGQAAADVGCVGAALQPLMHGWRESCKHKSSYGYIGFTTV